MTRYLFLSLIVTSAAVASSPPGNGRGDEPTNPYLDVIIFAGQSNMLGAGRVTDLPPHRAEFAEEIGDLRYRLWMNGYFSDDEWTALRPRSGLFIGPEMMFGHVLTRHRAATDLAFVKMAFNGTSMHCDWNMDGCGWRIASKIESVLGTVREELGQQDRIVRFAGLIWVQGESDSKAIWAAEGYVEDFQALLDHFREVTSHPHLPTVMARVTPEHPDHTHVDELHQSMFEIAAADPFVSTVTCEDLPLKEDQVHLTADAFIGLGGRLADAFLAMRPFEMLPAGAPQCPGDVDWNGRVDSSDLGLLMSQWQSPGGDVVDCDLNDDGIVDSLDLAVILAGWGPCN